jgi:hypothetical protein
VSWLRYDDRFTGDQRWDNVSHAARWHYIALVELCGATERYDGVLPLLQAQRASDVPDPDGALRELAKARKVKVSRSKVTLLTIDRHVPPPSIRNNAEQSKERMRRKRAHDAGDHTLCRPEGCPDVPVTGHVTRNPGTGQDGVQGPPTTTADQQQEGSTTPGGLDQ